MISSGLETGFWRSRSTFSIWPAGILANVASQSRSTLGPILSIRGGRSCTIISARYREFPRRSIRGHLPDSGCLRAPPGGQTHRFAGPLWASWSGAQDRTFHPTFFLKHFDGQTVTDMPIPSAAGEVYELADAVADMAEAVQTGRSPRVTAEDGMWAVELCLKARESVVHRNVVVL